jgi:hypothetical protein
MSWAERSTGISPTIARRLASTPTASELDAAKTEGWIAVPAEGSLQQLAVEPFRPA